MVVKDINNGINFGTLNHIEVVLTLYQFYFEKFYDKLNANFLP